jgi:hypothetical protein
MADTDWYRLAPIDFGGRSERARFERWRMAGARKVALLPAQRDWPILSASEKGRPGAGLYGARPCTALTRSIRDDCRTDGDWLVWPDLV